MFSDDNRVMWFIKYLVPYDEISSYSIVENGAESAGANQEPGVISRAIIGGAIAGGVELSLERLRRGRNLKRPTTTRARAFSCKSSRRTANDIAVTLKATVYYE